MKAASKKTAANISGIGERTLHDWKERGRNGEEPHGSFFFAAYQQDGRRIRPWSDRSVQGRLRQALSGDWVFNASTGQNGVVGFMLGSVGSNWNSSESPATGLQITITFQLAATAPNPINEVIVLTSVIPTDFAG